jgi:hypothetical protein
MDDYDRWLKKTISKTTSKLYGHIYFLNTSKLEDLSPLVCYLASTVK